MLNRNPDIETCIQAALEGGVDKHLIKLALNFAMGSILSDADYNDPNFVFADDEEKETFVEAFLKYLGENDKTVDTER